MAPIKFEEDIKDKIEQRQLQPSSNAWSKLSERLDAEPKRKTNKTYWWLSIAASFVGLLIVFSMLFSEDSENTIDAQILVNEDTESVFENKNTVEKILVEEEKIKEKQIANEEPKKEKERFERQILKTSESITVSKNKSLVITQQEQLKTEPIEVISHHETSNKNTVAVSKSPVDLKIDEVVNLIQKLQAEKSAVTDAEIDALLDQAQKELASERLYDANTKIVDAELLLLQVETDLDQSFRDRVFEALKSGYKKVKTAVAERNQ